MRISDNTLSCMPILCVSVGGPELNSALFGPITCPDSSMDSVSYEMIGNFDLNFSANNLTFCLSFYLPQHPDRNQCPANNANNERRPPIYPLDTSIFSDRYHMTTNRSTNYLANIPSPMLVSLSILTVLTIIGLLVYAKRTGQFELGLTSSSNNNNNRSSNNNNSNRDDDETQTNERRQGSSSLNN